MPIATAPVKLRIPFMGNDFDCGLRVFWDCRVTNPVPSAKSKAASGSQSTGRVRLGAGYFVGRQTSEEKNMNWLFQRIKRRIQRPSMKRKIAEFWAQHQKQPAPLSECSRLQSEAADVVSDKNPLIPPPSIRKGSNFRDPELAERLRGEDFGGWSPEIEAMEWLMDLVHQERPRVFLEFGGGRTTVCWCVILQRLHGKDGFRLLSIDQDAENVQRATNRLDGLPGQSSCRIIHAPLKPAQVQGRATSFYDIENVDRAHFAWLGKAEFVFVDGPFADGPGRYGTVPKVRPYLAPGARVIMDDALREKELAAGALWEKDGLSVDGVLTIGQGVMVGRAPKGWVTQDTVDDKILP